MKLASLKSGRDGRLVVVSRDLTRAADASAVAQTLQASLDDRDAAAPRLTELAAALERGEVAHVPFVAEHHADRYRARSSGSTVPPMSITSRWCARRAAPRCRHHSGPIH